MSIIEKFKAIKSKIKQNTAQCDLHRQTTKISALSSENVILLCTKDLKAKTDIAKKNKQY